MMTVVLRPEAAHVFQQISRSDAGDVMASLCAALMGAVEDTSVWASDQGAQPGWAMVLDIDQCPDFLLSWLGQFRGVQITPGTAPDEARRLIREVHGFERGTRAGTVSDIAQTLTGTRTVRVVERNGGPWTVLVVTRPSETPDTAATNAAAFDRRRKPLGIWLDMQQSEDALIDEGTRSIDTSTGTIDTAVLADIT